MNRIVNIRRIIVHGRILHAIPQILWPSEFVYIGRSRGELIGRWGNPFDVDHQTTREQVMDQYSTWLGRRICETPGFAEDLIALDGKILVCWCAPLPCHGDIMAKQIAEMVTEMPNILDPRREP